MRLNSHESVELIRPVAAQGRKEFIMRWVSEDKLTYTEELGDIVRQIPGEGSANLAANIYSKAKIHSKASSSILKSLSPR
jgi:clathrin heavy chain